MWTLSQLSLGKDDLEGSLHPPPRPASFSLSLSVLYWTINIKKYMVLQYHSSLWLILDKVA